MTRIFVQRGSSGGASSSSNPSRPPARTEPQASTPQVVSAVKGEESGEEVQEQVVVGELVECSGGSSSNAQKNEDLSSKADQNETSIEKVVDSDNLLASGELDKVLSGLTITENGMVENVDSSGDSSQNVDRRSQTPPPPPPVPPPKPSASNSNARRLFSASSNATRIGPSRRAGAWPVISTRTSPTESRPSSPRSHGESEGYNSADEQTPCYVSSYDDVVSLCILMTRCIFIFLFEIA